MSEVVGFSAVVLAALIPLVMAFLSLKKPPTWLVEGPLVPHWLKINIAAVFVSLCSAFLGWVLYSDFEILIQGTASLMCALLGFASTQFFFTDLWQRYADRRILWICNGLALVFGTYFIIQVFGMPTLLVYAILFTAATVIIHVPGIGASDGRALQLAVLTSVPLVGLLGFQYGLIGFLSLLLAFGIGNAIYRKDVKALVKKVSTPLVPMITLPFLVVILSHTLFLK